MGSLFDDLKQGLDEAIAYQRGEVEANVRTYTIKPVKEYTASEIRKVRMDAGMTQNVFAYYMGVSKKTVEAWERGSTHPTGTVFRLLDVLVEERFSNTRFLIER